MTGLLSDKKWKFPCKCGENIDFSLDVSYVTNGWVLDVRHRDRCLARTMFMGSMDDKALAASVLRTVNSSLDDLALQDAGYIGCRLEYSFV